MPITTTLSAIRKHRPCHYGWEKLLASLGKTKADNEPLEMAERAWQAARFVEVMATPRPHQ